MSGDGYAALLAVVGYAVVLHLLFWARSHLDWAARIVDWFGRITRHGPGVVLIWAFIADMLVVVFLVLWLRQL